MDDRDLTRHLPLGDLAFHILLALGAGDGHGYGIGKEIERRTGRDVSYGAVYTALDRLARKGWVAHRLGDPSPERGGRARKYFRVLPEGAATLRATRDALGVMWEGVDAEAMDV